MLERRHYELLAKYHASGSIDFDADELTIVCGVLNLNLTHFTEARLPEYRTLIVQALHEQSKLLTELGEYINLDNQGSREEALRYVVQNIAKIKSPFMLDSIVGTVSPQSRQSAELWPRSALSRCGRKIGKGGPNRALNGKDVSLTIFTAFAVGLPRRCIGEPRQRLGRVGIVTCKRAVHHARR